MFHLDTKAEAWGPALLGDGVIAIDEPCGASPTPTPAPTPTGTPRSTPTPTMGVVTPTATPNGDIAKGDVQCDGDIDPVDALMNLRFVAALQTTQVQPCPAIGALARVGSSGADLETWGDMDCDSDVDSVDALLILRHIAELPVNLSKGCPPLGS